MARKGTNGRATAAVLAVLALVAAMPVTALTGAIWTTDVNGVPVNQNLYALKCDVYLNGGPAGGGPGLPDGAYFFQVTNPNGALLLSSDPILERAFLVTGGVISTYLGTTHGWNTVGPGQIVIQLCPFLDTDNPGGEYKVWATRQSDYNPGDPGTTFGFSNSDSKTDNFKVRESQQNQPPVPCFTILPGDTVFEGDLVTLDGTCSFDPDGTIVSWEWDLDTSVDTSGDGDPANDVDATGAVVTFTWYDDYVSTVQLTVTDDAGATASATGTVTVLNVPPTSPTGIVATFTFDLGCRMAGSKWSNIECAVYTNLGDADNPILGTLLGSVEIERWPGSPDDNPTSTGSPFITISVPLGTEIVAVVTYDPYPDFGDAINGDQPNNGNDPFDNAGNPVWLLQRFQDGTECRLHHTFNTQQSMIRDSEHWNHVEPWIVPLTAAATAGAPISFSADATDPGSDDETFTWDFGDGSPLVVSTYFWDGAAADPLPSPYEPYGLPWDASGRTGIVPVYVTDAQTHTYASAGTYTVTLVISDDDGGFSTYTFDVTVVDGGLCG